jgi:hydrogenase maturation protease
MARTPLIIGVGNPIFGDDGFGIEVINALREYADEFADVEVVDGGTAGIYLLPYLENRHKVVVVDAANFGARPGEVMRISAHEVPKFVGLKLSEHQVTVHEVLALLDLMDAQPIDFELIGVQPRHHNFAEGLSREVEAAVPVVVEMLRDCARRWKQEEEEAHAADECAVLAS